MSTLSQFVAHITSLILLWVYMVDGRHRQSFIIGVCPLRIVVCYHQQQRLVILLVGCAAACHLGHHYAQHYELGHNSGIHRNCSSRQPCHHLCAVCHWALCGTLLPRHYRDGTGYGSKEYRLRHLGVERMVTSPCRSGARLLHPVAERIQQSRDLAPREAQTNA